MSHQSAEGDDVIDVIGGVGPSDPPLVTTRGRPSNGAATRSNVLFCRVRRDEAAALRRAADVHGQTVGNYVRDLVMIGQAIVSGDPESRRLLLASLSNRDDDI